MTLAQLQNRVQEQTDNEFDDVGVFLAILNIIIEDINLNNSAKFLTIDETTTDFTQQLNVLTGMPDQYNSILITGVSYKLQQKEDEPNWTNYEAQYIQLRNRYKHLVPEEYMLENFNDIEYRDCLDNWYIEW